VDAGRDVAEHLLGDIQSPDFGRGLLLLKDAGEAALAAAHIEHPASAKVAEVLADEFDVIDARIDGGGKMLFVARRLIEGALDAGTEFGGELFAPLSEKAFQATDERR
jgi:hypothetical protein